jgi:hypothetical protein
MLKKFFWLPTGLPGFVGVYPKIIFNRTFTESFSGFF